MTSAFDDAAWAWTEHLRSGGTTPWLGWLQAYDGARAAPADPIGSRGPVPGAAQLELVRRLAQRNRAPDGDPRFAELADLALARSGPGRGPARIPLLWPGGAGLRRHGEPPVDPAAIPVAELLRVGTGLLAELLVRAPRRTPAPARRSAPGAWRRRRPWRPAFRLVGAPVTVAELRAGLGAAGHVEGGRRPTVLVVAEPLDEMLGQVWSRRVQRGDSVRWETFVGRWVRRDRLPPAVDLAATARSCELRAGRVEVVTGPDVRRTVAQVLGAEVPRAQIGRDDVPTRPTSLSPAATDLLRGLNRVLNVRVDDATRTELVEQAAAMLPNGRGEPLAVPRRHRAWLAARAAALTEELRAGGYAVHGELARIAPLNAGATHPRRADVLAMVLDSCLAAAERTR